MLCINMLYVFFDAIKLFTIKIIQPFRYTLKAAEIEHVLDQVQNRQILRLNMYIKLTIIKFTFHNYTRFLFIQVWVYSDFTT